MINFPDRDGEFDDDESIRFASGQDASSGVQRTLEIKDGDTYVTDEDLLEDTSLNLADPELQRGLYAAAANPLEGLPTEEEALRAAKGDSEPGDDDGEDPIPVPA